MKDRFKKWLPILTAMLLGLLLLTACGAEQTEPTGTSQPPRESDQEAVPVETAAPFTDVANLEFVFASGAGGWGTVLYIHGDGTFDGCYTDSLMETGPGYPGGSYYYSAFSGHFTQPEQVDDTTWRFQIAELTEARERGTEEIRDGVRYLYSAPHGLSDSEDWYLYLPGAQLEDLPQPFLDWVRLPHWYAPDETELTTWGLYNEKEEFGFYGYEPTEPEAELQEFTFADVADLEFNFSSGAGGWGTVLYIHEDGTFDGSFHDHDADEAYPKGITFFSGFSGRFAQPERIDAYTYRLRMEEFTDQRNREDQLFGGVYYDFGDVYGIEDTRELLLYLPGAKLEDLPQGFRDWVGYNDLSYVKETELPFYGLYNEEHQEGFWGGPAMYRVDVWLEGLEEGAAQLEEVQINAMTQTDMNIAADNLYRHWDDALNDAWRKLFERLDQEEMARLTREQLTWITEKEAAAKEAAKDVEGGTMYPMVYYSKAAQLTRERVYFLAEYLK